MASLKTTYGTNTALTITLGSLANSSCRQSAVVDNSSNLFLDALVSGKIKTGTSPTANNQIPVYAYATTDDSSAYTGAASGSDAAYSPSPAQLKSNLILVGVITIGSTSDITYDFGPWSLAAAFGGTLPKKWGIVIDNLSGATLNSTGHAVAYQGVYGTIS